ncbi:DEAD-box ATP-dependent RNA helicase ISE2, chloroplastic-like protein [Corchorus olitorius]|uniref:DEAD-box ATP-dependent RNA helicase ISE2, chloroplastic-like protein n=1 Tax=Corchorus olitorius TaxID=93759 RepID=A0A1R3KT33_9ROSI|nr:DEAD-box ATP-dependent RNA helicase ISE2, chloroplastic-like protein [Corchorus olitorius]
MENKGWAFAVGVEVYIKSVEIFLSFNLGVRMFNFEMDPSLPTLPTERGGSVLKRKVNQKIKWEPLMWDHYKPFTCMVYNSHGETPTELIERVT